MRLGDFHSDPSPLSTIQHKSNMLKAMISPSAGALHHRTLLLELDKPATISAAKCDEVWPSVYTKLLASEMLQCNSSRNMSVGFRNPQNQDHRRRQDYQTAE